MRRRKLSAALAATLVVLIGAAWVALAPTQIGGRAAFVIVNGNSMEPALQRGDLVIARAAPAYQVGEIVTYRHPQIGPVIHRIIALDGDRYVFKGDHNGWVDFYRPDQAELIGALWVRLPGAGRAVAWLRQPIGMVALTLVIGGTLMITATDEQARRRQRLRRYAADLRAPGGAGAPAGGLAQPARDRARRPACAWVGGAQRAAALALACCAALALALGVLAFAQPAERVVSDDLAYTQSGAFEYAASAPDGVYDANTARSGEPIFRRLVSQVRLRFSYRVAADAPHQLGGSYRVVAEVGAADGWRRAIELRPDTAFAGDRFTFDGALDLARVQALIDSMERQTGIARPQYSLTLAPQVALAGTLGGQSLSDSFAPRLSFQINPLELQLQRDGASADDPLAPSRAGLVKRQQTKPATIGPAGLAIDVALARWLAPLLAALAGVGALALGIRLAMTSVIDESARIQRQYAPLLIAIQDSDLADTDHVVEVASIADLARLAERDERMILYERRGPVNYYVVPIAGVSYMYRAVEAAAAARGEL